MAETNDSVAIAAPQVGVLKRVFCVHDTTTEFPFRAFFNPRVVKVHNRRRVQLYAESCLSLPNVVGIVQRPMHITVAYDDEKGDARSVELHGYWAQTVQHELDHLDGTLFTDRLAAPVTWSLDEFTSLSREDVRSIGGLELTVFDLVAWARFDDGTHLLSKR